MSSLASMEHVLSPVKTRPEIPRWDQELRKAKNSGKFVKFQLATEAFFADEDCVVIGMVLETDKSGIKIIQQSSKRSFWIAKALIVGTEILS